MRLDLQVGLKVYKGVMALLIGELARKAGVSAPTIRYYEEIGLLPASSRTTAGYRRYTDAALQELRFIRKAQGLGFSLEEIAEILKLSRSGGTPCAEVLTLARQHLAAVDERLAQLRQFRDHLASELGKWDGRKTPTCQGLCQIIENADELAADRPTLPTRTRPRGRGPSTRSRSLRTGHSQ